MATLYELTGQLLRLQEIMEESEPEYIQTVLDTMEGLDAEIEAKADGYARIMRNLSSDIEGLESEIKRLTQKKNALEANIETLKRNLQKSMEMTGKEKFKTKLFSFGIQNNPPAVVMDVQYIENVPEEYLIPQDPKIDRAKIKEDLKAGKNLEGIAHLEQGRSLRIK